MRRSITTPPSGTVVEWNALKARAKIDDDATKSDTLDILAEVVADAEERMECSLLPRTITAIYDREDREIVLERGPIITIDSVKDGNNNDLTYHHETYGNLDRLHFTQPRNLITWPVTVLYQAGFAEVPADIVGVIKTQTLTRLAFRENLSEKSANNVYDLDAFYRRRGRGSVVA